MVQENIPPRVVTRVTRADGSTINVRNDELDAWVTDNPGAIIDGRAAAEVIAEPEAEQPAEDAPPRATRATRATPSPRARRGA